MNHLTNFIILDSISFLGANTGIGRETALELAKRGGRIYLACRDLVKADGARLDIIHKSGNRNIFTKKLDLSSFESIRKFVDEYVRLHWYYSWNVVANLKRLSTFAGSKNARVNYTF